MAEEDPMAELRAKYGHYFDGVDPVAYVADLRGDGASAEVARAEAELAFEALGWGEPPTKQGFDITNAVQNVRLAREIQAMTGGPPPSCRCRRSRTSPGRWKKTSSHRSAPVRQCAT